MARSYLRTTGHAHRMVYFVFKVLGVCFVSLFLLLQSTLSASAHSSTTLSPMNSTDPCISGGSVTCFGWFSEYAEAGCNLEKDVYLVRDATGAPIRWIYSHGNLACVGVNYYPYPVVTSKYCDFFFYIPAGHATATVIFNFWDTNGTKYSASLNENNYFGWTYAFTGLSTNRINFQDDNGEAVGSSEIGWGDTTTYGFKRIC